MLNARSLLAMVAGAVLSFSAPALAAGGTDPQPLASSIATPVKDCPTSGVMRVPTIAWGADIATSLANGNAVRSAPGSLFAAKGLDVELYRQDSFPQQVTDYLSCKTPFIRGTMGMLGTAAEALNRDPRTAPVVIYQLSWSAGGDALVVKDGIRSPKDLKGKTIAVQAYGPHVDYLTTILKDAGLTTKDVHITWVPDLLQVDASSMSPARAFREQSDVDAAFVIIPDALALTSGGAVGTGSEDSVRGASIMLSTKTANRVIADVYAVRADYFKAHRQEVLGFVGGLLKAEEDLRPIMKAKGAAYGETIGAAAELLLDSRSATEDTAAMYADAEMAGYRGNVAFFGDPNYPRGFDKLSGEIQSAFVGLGLLSKQTPLAHAQWDYAALAQGLSDTANVTVPRFDAAAVAQLVERRTQQGASAQGTLFEFEVYFAPNQNSFPVAQYSAAFERVVELATTYGGAVLTVEGHSDPLGYLRLKNKGGDAMVLRRTAQAAKNLSYSRANAVKDSIIAYAQGKGITLDDSQFGVLGHGVMQPNTPNCTHDSNGDIALSCAPATEQEWNATRRVVFRIVQVEAESSVFKPL